VILFAEPQLDLHEGMAMYLQYPLEEREQMNADEMNWLLQTIQDPETAKHFVLAQYERGRISYELTMQLARQHGWSDYVPVRVLTAPSTSIEHATA
jgi:hypothetical protein